MKRHSLLALAVVSGAGALFTACSSDSSSSSATPSVTSLAALPAATGPVTSSREQAIRPASAGRALTAWHDNDGDNWGAAKSGPMCQAGEMVMRMLSDAAQPDKILCYVGAMEASGFFTASYNGSNRFYVLSNPPTALVRGQDGRAVGDMPIKFNITKTGAAITDFKMWMCMTTSKNRAADQMEYVSTSLTNGTATVTSVGVHAGAGFSASQRTVATGNFNSSGDWTSKNITNTGSFSGGAGASAFQHKQQLSLTQGTDNYVLNGYFNGYHGGFSNTQTGQIYAKIQGLNLSSLATAALGDGTAYYSFTFPGPGKDSGQRPTTYSATRSWNGDTQSPVTADSGVYYSAVNGQTLPDAAAISEPSFEGAEAWNCDTTDQTVTTIDMGSNSFLGNASLQAALLSCNSQYGFSNNNMTDCRAANYDEPSH
ncbi:MAG: hypothetical protein FJ116_02220 [Deltaproteobacteria bacterium]|nr:hypothetical protein [Deltaproteobacteria bacterium]